MATSDKLEGGIKVGLAGIKQTMQNMKTTIKETEDRADRTERERDQAKNAYNRAYNKQMALRDKIIDVEETCRKTEEKIKDVSRRLAEKERYLLEAAKFHNELVESTPAAGELETMEKQLKVMKRIYGKNFEMCQKARNKKIDLEQKVDFAESRAHEAKQRLDRLNTELEYNRAEEVRRSDGCKEAIDAAFRSEKECLTLERNLGIVLKRKEVATQRITDLEGKIAKVENSIETINFDRRRIEATVREILINVKRQSKQ